VLDQCEKFLNHMSSLFDFLETDY